MPIYKTTATLGAETEERIIEATNDAQALRFAAKKYLTIEIVRSGEQIRAMAALAAKGVAVEKAEAEPTPAT